MLHRWLGHDDVSHVTDRQDDALGPTAHLQSWSDIAITIFACVCFTRLIRLIARLIGQLTKCGSELQCRFWVTSSSFYGFHMPSVVCGCPQGIRLDPHNGTDDADPKICIRTPNPCPMNRGLIHDKLNLRFTAIASG